MTTIEMQYIVGSVSLDMSLVWKPLCLSIARTLLYTFIVGEGLRLQHTGRLYINTDIISVRRSRWIFCLEKKSGPVDDVMRIYCNRNALGQAFLGRSCSTRINTHAGHIHH
jgi:hypothetical protein